MKTALVGGGAYIAARVAEEAAVRVLLDPVVDNWWEKRPAPLVTPPRMGKRDILERASPRQARALALLEAGEALDDDILGRTTITHRRRGKRVMERQGEGIALWPGWGGESIPMDDQPDGEYGAWAARQLDEAELLGEPVLDKVSAKVMTTDGGWKWHDYSRLRIPAGRAVYSVTEKV